MLDFPRWKQIWFWSIALVAALAAVPSIFALAGAPWPAALPHPVVNLGLDLAGGSHILLEADTGQVRRQRLDSMEEEVRHKLKQAGPGIGNFDVSTADGKLSVLLANPAQVDAVREAVLPLTTGVQLTGARDWDLQVLDGNRVVLTPTDQGINAAIDRAMETATEVVRKRIDALGTREPTIIRQGAQRIVVQVPGLKDTQELKNLLNKTAMLEFKLVDGTADISQGVAPLGDQIVPYADPAKYGPAVAVKRLGGIKGDQLIDAQVGNDQQTNEAIVEIKFDQQGGAKFAKLTSENVGKPFAIILDGKAISAPVIKQAILGGQATISGDFNTKTANELAISLRSGALPVDLKVVEERSVGPDLGADSIRKGILAIVVGTIAIVVLIAVSYGRFGLYADLALIINVLMILGIMAVTSVSLTLPGIAGFVLTIGAAVDANVLINERIREERKRGRKVMQAIDVGYTEASRTIFDANITHFIAATLMFLFGSGPIKGFAVVLMIGLVTSVFTAVYLTRMWAAVWVRKARPTELVI